jgi:hypothetical protein
MLLAVLPIGRVRAVCAVRRGDLAQGAFVHVGSGEAVVLGAGSGERAVPDLAAVDGVLGDVGLLDSGLLDVARVDRVLARKSSRRARERGHERHKGDDHVRGGRREKTLRMRKPPVRGQLTLEQRVVVRPDFHADRRWRTAPAIPSRLPQISPVILDICIPLTPWCRFGRSAGGGAIHKEGEQ